MLLKKLKEKKWFNSFKINQIENWYYLRVSFIYYIKLNQLIL